MQKEGECKNIILQRSLQICESPLYERNSLTEEYKCTKVTLDINLTESQDAVTQAAAPRLVTGSKWNPTEAIQQAQFALSHGDIVGQVQQGRGGFGLGTTHMEQSNICSEKKTDSIQGSTARGGTKIHKGCLTVQTGQWTNWENLEHHKLTWKDLWEMERSRLSFIIRATYDILPTPSNLNQWIGEDPSCHLCQTPATLRHILVGYKTSLSQGRYTWRHNQVLRQLAVILEGRRITNNVLPPPRPRFPEATAFVRAGQLPMCVNLTKVLVSPEVVQQGWGTQLLPVEVWCRGFVAMVTARLLKGLGVRGLALRQAVRSLSEAAERSSNWLWLKGKDPKWARGAHLGFQVLLLSPLEVSWACQTPRKEGAHLMTPVK
ncbi:Homeobox protein ceh-38 [Labeo rohita]|uniref:Homeobox protein ceh-38 n=1 Tax=Labeo rohita TaxID=84645 RepID=A0ABQ8LDG7_LABRO|nr:Homeobox protein ceh-38 [Labeo rohita]